MTPRKPAAQRRADIVEVALRLAAAQGPESITAEAIAAELGVSQPAIFRHFPRKDAIWEAALEWLQSELAETWQKYRGDGLSALVGAHLAFITDHPALPLVLLSPELQARHPPIRQAVANLSGQFHAVLSALMAEAGASDPVRAAWLVIALIQGLALRWVVSGHAFDLAGEGLALLALARSGLDGAHNHG